MLRWIFTMLSITVLSVLMCVNEVPAVDGEALMAYWSFDKGAGKTVPDDSGNGNDGKIEDAKWSKKGKIGGAMSFDAVGAFVDVASQADLDPGEDDWTVEVWIKRADTAEPAGNSGWQKILTKYPGAWNGYRIGLLNSSVHVIFGTGENNKVEFNTQTKIQDTDWHHLALVVDRGGDAVIYIDGEPDATTANVEHINAVATDKNVEIGRCHWCQAGAVMGFFGILDEIKLWRAALTEDEVQLAMSGKLGGAAVSPSNALPITWGKLKWIEE